MRFSVSLMSKKTFGVFTILVFLLSITGNVLADNIIITAHGNSADLGYFTSIALSNSGNPSISYLNADNGNIYVLTCSNPQCTPFLVARPIDTGTRSSLELNNNGYPVLSYESNGDLKIAVCQDVTCLAKTTKILASTGDVGNYNSLELDSSGYPVISYYDLSNTSLNLTYCISQPDCSSGIIINREIDNSAIVGSYSSLALNSSGFPVISYFDATNGDLKLAVCSDATCVNKATVTVDSAGTVGYYSSLALNSNDYPVISYYDNTNSQLKIAVCGNTTCTSGNNITTLDNTVTSGIDSSVALNNNGYPVVAYQNLANHDLKIARCGNSTCSSGNIITTLDAPGNVGSYTSLAINNNNEPVISYFDESNSDLKLAIADIVSPTITLNERASANPSSASIVNFNVAFSETVQNVDVNDFTLTTTGVSGTSITGVTPVSASVYTVSVNTGTGSGTIRLDVPDTATIKDLSNNDLSGLPFTSGEVYTIDKSTPLPTGWVGSVSVTSDKSLVSVGRPHIGSEVASYDGFASGSTNAFVPMLFKDAFGGDYDAALYIQNVSGSSASVTLEFYDTSGSLNCTKSDSIAPLASKGYWLPSVSCTSGSLPSGWVGGVKVSSDQPIVAVGRPHIGSEVMTYNGFSSGSTSAFIPMLFKDAFGGSYDSAFYIQNVGTSSASVTIQYFDNSGSLNCTKSDSIASFASKGYWLPSATCDSGSLPTGWVGGVKVSSDQPIVTVGRPHIGSQITTYDGFSAGSSASFVPMLFKGAFGGSYDSAFYLQNTGASSASVTIEYYDNSGSLNCTKSDAIAPLASKGYWLPSATCDTGSLPAGWVGGVKVSSDQPVVAVGRPHIGSQITTYNGFPSGAVSAFLPMLFKDAFGGEYDSAFYLQNTEASEASVTIQFFDNTGTLTCSRTDTIQPRATLGFWVPSASCYP